MAGTTLRGIGDEESDEKDTSSQSESDAQSPAKPGGKVEDDRQIAGSGPTVVDNAKVAEGLRRLRSLDELPGAQTGLTKPLPAAVESLPVVAPPSDSDRVSFGTMLGHELHHVELPPETNRSLRGTVLGHDVHLAEQLSGHEVSREASREATGDGSGGVPEATAFSGGDHTFFDTEPVNNEFEPERPPRRLAAPLAVGGALLALVLVVVIAWVRSSPEKSDVPAPEPKTAQAAHAPRTPEPPTSTIPSSSLLPSSPTALAPATGAPSARPRPTPAIAPPPPAPEPAAP
jgi:hypothetical protein